VFIKGTAARLFLSAFKILLACLQVWKTANGSEMSMYRNIDYETMCKIKIQNK